MKIDIVRAWKDEEYRQQLSSEEQALLPANPAGELELSDADLEAIHGAGGDKDDGGNSANSVGCFNTNALLIGICYSQGAFTGNCSVL